MAITHQRIVMENECFPCLFDFHSDHFPHTDIALIAESRPADLMAFLWSMGGSGWVVCYTIAYLPQPTTMAYPIEDSIEGRFPL